MSTTTGTIGDAETTDDDIIDTRKMAAELQAKERAKMADQKTVEKTTACPERSPEYRKPVVKQKLSIFAADRPPIKAPYTEKDYERCSIGRTNPIVSYITPISRVIGFVTFVVVLGVAIKTLADSPKLVMGWYLLIISPFICLLEVAWIIDAAKRHRANKKKAADKDSPTEIPPASCLDNTWKVVMWASSWRRSLVYIAVSLICFFVEQRTTVILAGLMLVLAAFFHFLTIFQDYAHLSPGERWRLVRKDAATGTADDDRKDFEQYNKMSFDAGYGGTG